MAQTKSSPTIRRVRDSISSKTYTFAGVTLVAVLIFLLGAIRPTLSAISRIQNEVKEKERIDAQLQNKINTLTELQETLGEYEDDLNIIETYFPSGSDYSILMASMERITASHGFEMSSLSIKQDETDETGDIYTGMKSVEMKFSGNGPRTQVSNLLEHLENMVVIPDIPRISYVLDESYRTGFINLSVVMTIYKMDI
ncbi:MAG: hypothetical protein ABIC57_03190 [bacterium]